MYEYRLSYRLDRCLLLPSICEKIKYSGVQYLICITNGQTYNQIPTITHVKQTTLIRSFEFIWFLLFQIVFSIYSYNFLFLYWCSWFLFENPFKVHLFQWQNRIACKESWQCDLKIRDTENQKYSVHLCLSWGEVAPLLSSISQASTR